MISHGVCLDMAPLPPFHRRVYEAARSIQWGTAITYGDLAKATGAPGAARAVGQALACNPVGHRSCHRVAAAGGKIGGFSAHGGAQMKLKLLAIEGQTIAADIRDASRVNARCLAAIHENCHGRLWMLPGASRQERATKNEGRYGLA